MPSYAAQKAPNPHERVDLLKEYKNWGSPKYPHAELLQEYLEYPSKKLWLQACHRAVKDENREWLENPPLDRLYSRAGESNTKRKNTARFISTCALKALLIKQASQSIGANEVGFQDIVKDAHVSDESVKDLIQYFGIERQQLEDEKVAVKVLLAGNEGKLGQLVIEKIPNGEGKIFPDPAFMAFSRFETDFEESIKTAFKYISDKERLEEAKKYNYRWRLLDRSNTKKEDNNFGVLDQPLRGSSMGFASAIAFRQLFRPLKFSLARYAFTGKIDENGNLKSVGEYPSKLQAGKNFTIYFPEVDHEEIKHYGEDGYSIKEVVTVNDAVADIKNKNRKEKLIFAGSLTGIAITMASIILLLVYAENERKQKELVSRQYELKKQEGDLKDQQLVLKSQQIDVAQKDKEAEKQNRLNEENKRKNAEKETQLSKERETLAKQQSKILAQKNVQLDAAKQTAEKNEKEATFQKSIAERNKKISDTYKQIAYSYNYYMEGEKALQENNGTVAKQFFVNALFLFDNYDFRFNFLRTLFESNSVENTWNQKTDFQGMEIPFFGESRNFYSVASSNKAGIVAIGGQEGIKIFNQENGAKVVSITGKGSVSSLAFSEKYNLLFATWFTDERSTFSITNLNSPKFETQSYEIQDCMPNALTVSDQRNILIVACINTASDNSITGKIIASDLIDIKFIPLKNTNGNSVFDQILFDKNDNLITKAVSSNDRKIYPEGIKSSILKNGKLYVNSSGWIAGNTNKNELILTGTGIDSYNENGENISKEKDRNFFFRGNVNQSGKLLVTCDINNTISIWRLEDMSQLLTVQSNEALSQVFFTSENSFISISVSGEVRNYKFALPETIKNDDEIFSLSYSKNDRQLAVTEPGGFTNFYDLQTHSKIKVFNPLNIDFSQFGVTKQQIIDRTTPFSENPKISWTENVIFSGAIGDWIVLADFDTNSSKLKIKKEGNITASLISKDGKLFAVAEELPDKKSLIRIWDIKSNEEIFNITNDKPDEGDEHNNILITALAFSPDSKLIALGYADSYFEVWDIKEKNRPWSNFLEQPYPISNLAFSFDNTYLAASTIFSNVGLWKFYPETHSTAVRKVNMNSPISQLEFFPKDNVLALTIPLQKRIFVWDYLNSTKAVGINKDKNFLGFTFSNDNSTMAYFDDENKIYFWKTEAIKDALRLDNQQYLNFIGSYPKDFSTYLSNEELKNGLGVTDTRETTYGELKYRENTNAATQKNNENINSPFSSLNFEFGKTTDINEIECYSALGFSSKAELNSIYPLTFTSPAEPCARYPTLDIRRKDGAYSRDENDWKDGIKVSTNEEFYGLIYITNVAQNKAPDSFTDPRYTAQNVKVKVEIDNTIGSKHWIKVTLSSDNTNVITECVPVLTGPDDHIQLVPNSGILTDNQAKNVLMKNITLGKNPFIVGDIPPGFSTDRFIRFSVKVKQKT